MTDNNIIIMQNNNPLPNGNLLLVFSTTWCGPCKSLVPVLDSIGNIMHRENMEVKIVKIDCEENQEISRQYNIRQVPSLILSIAGEKFEYNGIRDEINIIKWIKDKI